MFCCTYGKIHEIKCHENRKSKPFLAIYKIFITLKIPYLMVSFSLHKTEVAVNNKDKI